MLMPIGIGLAIGLTVGLTMAQTPAPGPVLSYTATTDNIGGAHDSVRIDVLRWSTDAERDQLLSAWTKAGAPARADPPAGKAATGKKAAAKAGGATKGGAPEDEVAPPPAKAAARTPETGLANALDKAPTVGYLWSSEITGYALRYSVRMSEPDGGENVTLITERRLGAWNNLWKPVGPGTPTNYEFSVIELHFNSKGEGEGKISLTGKVVVDSAVKTIGLENYGALPVVLKSVRRRTS